MTTNESTAPASTGWDERQFEEMFDRAIARFAGGPLSAPRDSGPTREEVVQSDTAFRYGMITGLLGRTGRGGKSTFSGFVPSTLHGRTLVIEVSPRARRGETVELTLRTKSGEIDYYDAGELSDAGTVEVPSQSSGSAVVLAVVYDSAGRMIAASAHPTKSSAHLPEPAVGARSNSPKSPKSPKN
ncbi:hypothetical protein I6E68_09400 [Salinibacterium sp. NSLL150]|uniref:hypothetical protein n=1 Tax=unclassified Salinibacterium TaxID=2632331 RepID=UPI0018CEBC99|nr:MULTISPECIES: hypothetical protein [unclassified Salinibacterium]MBH0099354.1 hypothetical protein [Salinibacterium sp. NSLL35]MBH0102108.1 hypothetical protein [Salinibacterium sp. NSLL150]MBH0104868.1 hypothetical protein [Salinibacterium sp. NSLL16]MBH0107628.1 hypothetical protein [Salinibacterium sp. NSLL17]MBH0108576.1 hypothetical protein [Salinibacterium sp. NG22]